MIEIHTIDGFDDHVERVGSLAGVVVQGVDLSDRSDVLLTVSCRGAAFLGSRLRGPVLERLLDGGAVVFPRLPSLPFDTYRSRLYSQAELLGGWRVDVDGSFERDSLDSRIYAWSSQRRHQGAATILDTLAQRLHDHAIDDALGEHLAAHGQVVAVMGGHALTRREPAYRTVAELGRAMTREGWHVATGGGPGAMEAANLGAWLAPHHDGALDDALSLLGEEADYRRADPYLRAGRMVLDAFPVGGESLAVPTWFYGHEPTNQFATSIAKYFANSIREDGLLAMATRGVVFARGSAGTIQEVFQDATQNHYDVFGTISPMVFLDAGYWRDELPVEPLLRRLAGERPYATLIGAVDSAAEAMEFLRRHPPIVGHRG